MVLHPTTGDLIVKRMDGLCIRCYHRGSGRFMACVYVRGTKEVIQEVPGSKRGKQAAIDAGRAWIRKYAKDHPAVLRARMEFYPEEIDFDDPWL